MILDFVQHAVSSSVYTVSDITSDYLGKATHVILQAGPAGTIRYCISLATDTPTTTNGMRLLAGGFPELFLIQDFRNMKWTRESVDTTLQIHFCAGRDI